VKPAYEPREDEVEGGEGTAEAVGDVGVGKGCKSEREDA
jgi:hypothetical protein